MDRDSELIAEEVRRQLLKMLASHTLLRMSLVIIAAVLIAYFAHSSGFFVWWVWGGWLALLFLFECLRWWLPRYYYKQNHTDVRSAIRKCVFILLTNATMLGVSCVIFPYVENFQKAIVTMIVMGTSSVVISSTTGYRPIGIFYVFPAMVPPFLTWGLNPVHNPQAGSDWFHLVFNLQWVDMIIAVIGIGYASVLVSSGSDSFERFRESVALRLQLDSLNRQLQVAVEKSEEASAAKTRFLASASHDLRQPIHTVTLLSAALSLQGLDEKARNIVLHIKDSLAGLSSQLDRLLDISKLDAGVIALDESTFDISILVEDLSRDYVMPAEAKGLMLSCVTRASSCVRTDRALVERVLRNLIDNAIKYTEKGGVSIEQGEKDSRYYVSIRDSGRGMEDHHKRKIFEEFYQIDNPHRDRKQGLGLGLAIVDRLVKLLGVDFDFESELGRGSVFRIYFPKVSKPINCTDTGAINGSLYDGRMDPVRLLVIDDEYEIRWGMKALFEEKGYAVLSVESVAEARVAVNNFVPDVLLVDFRLGGGENGIDAIRQLREILGAIPALLISGDTAPDRLREARQAGIKLLSKPVSVELLESAILDEVIERG